MCQRGCFATESDQSLRRAQTRNQVADETEAAGAFQSEQDIAALRGILKQIVEGPAFRGSQRSAQFLKFVVEQSIAGNVDQLKERLIGIHLFKRSPSYDTGEDAIVRVTASDVRRRLLQHYGWFGTGSEFRLDLPSGCYVPRITRKSPEASDPHEPIPAPDSLPSLVVAQEPDPGTVVLQPLEAVSPVDGPKKGWPLWRNLGVLLLAVAFGWWLNVLGHHMLSSTQSSTLPWSVLFGGSTVTHLVTSDPAIDAIQGVTRTDLSLSDYANHRYIPELNKLSPEQIRISKLLLGVGSSAATPDLPTTAKLAQIAQVFSKTLEVQASRNFQLSYLSNNDNFILLGSPRSNPWFSLFENKLDFRFVYDHETNSEFIRNIHPRPSEQQAYVPSAIGGGTGYSFAIVAFIQNPGQNGQVLLLAGADGEGTAAAGNFVTDLPQISRALQNCGISPAGPLRHFEILLRTETMAGVSRETDVAACHLLL